MTPIDLIINFFRGLLVIIGLLIFIGGPLILVWQLAKISKEFCERQGCIMMFALWCFVFIVSVVFTVLMILIGALS